MLAWLSEHQMLLTWLSIASLATFIGSLLALPWMVAMIPEDYFLYGNRETTTLKKRHPVIRGLLLVGKNLLGLILLCGGFLMLFMPGQGILTMAVGLLLLDYPGKYTLEKRIVSTPSVLKGLNWLRAKRHLPTLKVDKP
ncbi:MAG: hypothetical protein COA29_03740 [Porticoccus sp.]|jgi:archaellum biogenesis protein FlaJ (TadC family)|nr:MAG: hypothetical protein COA29_03740 [Porticoccus sp.]